MGAPPGGFGSYGGMGLGSMGGMSGQGAMGGMGAPPRGYMASLVDPSPSTNEAYGDSTGNTIVQDFDEDAQHGGGGGIEDVDK
jgi:hypothetical protein